jgi:hypothetical protein
MFRIELDREMAWVTFMGDGFESIWHPVTDASGEQLEWSEEIMDFCRAQFNNTDCWISFGIAPTSQMLVKNSVRDNL